MSSVIFKVNSVPMVIPESNPAGSVSVAARGVHGLAKEDCTTEWGMPLLCESRSELFCYGCIMTYLGKKNVMMVPIGAVKLAGWKTKPSLKPTST